MVEGGRRVVEGQKKPPTSRYDSLVVVEGGRRVVGGRESTPTSRYDSLVVVEGGRPVVGGQEGGGGSGRRVVEGERRVVRVLTNESCWRWLTKPVMRN